jgi:putative transposase
MRLMGLMPIYQKPNTSKAAKGHKTYPYLLRGLRVDRPNQVWAADITYLPMWRGFLYLVAIMEWHTRKVLVWRISNTLEADFCVETLNEAIARFGPPEIMNTAGQPIHILCLDRPAAPIGCAHLNGWQGAVPRQHLRGTALAEPKIRMRLPARLANRIRGEGRCRQVDRVLQPQTSPLCPWRQTPSRGLLAEK